MSSSTLRPFLLTACAVIFSHLSTKFSSTSDSQAQLRNDSEKAHIYTQKVRMRVRMRAYTRALHAATPACFLEQHLAFSLFSLICSRARFCARARGALKADSATSGCMNSETLNRENCNSPQDCGERRDVSGQSHAKAMLAAARDS